MNLELCQINNIMKNNVNNYNRRFKHYEILCKWKIVFYIDISMGAKSKVLYRISVLRENLEKYLKIKIILYKRRGLEFSHITEMNITFVTSLNHMTYKLYIEQTMPMVERLINKKLYKIYDFMKTLDGIDRTLHMGYHETGKADVQYNSGS